MKTCISCKQPKPELAANRSECPGCSRLYYSRYRKKNKKRINESGNRYYHKTGWALRSQKKYGITPEKFDEMTPDQQRIAIAEACGWTRGEREEASFSDPSKKIKSPSWIHPRGYAVRSIPDYLNDLNAMHEAEKTLTDDEATMYSLQINIIMDRDKYVENSKLINICDWHATARQRAEAFCKTKGLLCNLRATGSLKKAS